MTAPWTPPPRAEIKPRAIYWGMAFSGMFWFGVVCGVVASLWL